MATYPGDNGGYGHGNGHPGGSDNPGPWDTMPYDPYEGNGNGGGCDGPGMVKSGIDANGDYFVGNGGVAGQFDCVDEAEYQRRVAAHSAKNPIGPTGAAPTPGAPKAGGGSTPAGKPNYGKAPVFNAPTFAFGEQFKAPSFEDALNDPGYQFRAAEGNRALQQSAAARGLLGSGGTLKDIDAWGQNFAKQEYGDVFNRALTGYQARFGQAKDIYDRNYQGAKDAYAPTLTEWLTNAHGTDLGWEKAWENYFRNTLSAQDIWNKAA